MIGTLELDGIIEKRLVSPSKMSGFYEVPPIRFKIPSGFKSHECWPSTGDMNKIILTDCIRFILELQEIWKA